MDIFIRLQAARESEQGPTRLQPGPSARFAGSRHAANARRDFGQAPFPVYLQRQLVWAHFGQRSVASSRSLGDTLQPRERVGWTWRHAYLSELGQLATASKSSFRRPMERHLIYGHQMEMENR